MLLNIHLNGRNIFKWVILTVSVIFSLQHADFDTMINIGRLTLLQI